MIDFVLTFLVQVTNMGIVVEVLGELENFHMSREELEVRYYIILELFFIFNILCRIRDWESISTS